jgi:MarR family transcriptional regulator, 2-MHQ and catechol-resistance regulon repressor
MHEQCQAESGKKYIRTREASIMPTRYPGTEEEVRALNAYIKLQRAAESVLARTNAHLAAYGLNTSQFAVLEALYFLGTLSQRDLAEKLLKSTGNMSTVLKHMEERGMISRERDTHDQRYMRVSITLTGRVLIDGVMAAHVAGVVADMAVLSPDEQDELGRLCKKLGLRDSR